LIYPEGEVGKKFWKRIYEEAEKKFGTTNIPVNTFNKVWIVPEKAVVYENVKAGTAYVVESKLKVMLEQDYLSLEKHSVATPQNDVNALGSQIVREIVIPELTKEINEGKNFAQLRQVYNSLILATWYKKKIKDSILQQVYDDQKKVDGVNIDDLKETQRIYQRYLQAFKKGAYNYIQEDLDPVTQVSIPRKYFSGGFFGAEIDRAMTTSEIPPDQFNNSRPLDIAVNLSEAGGDKESQIIKLLAIKQKKASNWLELFSLGRKKLKVVHRHKITVAQMAQALNIAPEIYEITTRKITDVISHFEFSYDEIGIEPLAGAVRTASNLKKVQGAIDKIKKDQGEEYLTYQNVQEKSGLTPNEMKYLGRDKLISMGVRYNDMKAVSERLRAKYINEVKSLVLARAVELTWIEKYRFAKVLSGSIGRNASYFFRSFYTCGKIRKTTR
jgi:hypothetical protein